jgi:hypothetical protein
VKIRGTAAHIADKYMSLARDAIASGDMVTAESYLQHAEHYNRIIMAAQQQMGQHMNHQAEGPNGGFRPQRWTGEGAEDEGEEAGEGGAEIRTGGGDVRQGGGREDRRYGGNGRENARDQNGGDQADPVAPDDTTTDQVS